MFGQSNIMLMIRTSCAELIHDLLSCVSSSHLSHKLWRRTHSSHLFFAVGSLLWFMFSVYKMILSLCDTATQRLIRETVCKYLFLMFYFWDVTPVISCELQLLSLYCTSNTVTCFTAVHQRLQISLIILKVIVALLQFFFLLPLLYLPLSLICQ